MNKQKLCCQAINIYNLNNKCRKISYITLDKIRLCLTHAMLNHNKKIIYIQKIYRGHYYRRKMRILFIGLPRDIQELVLFHINKDIYTKRYFITLNKIIFKKTYSLISYNSYAIITPISIDYILKGYKLYIKYCKITCLNMLKLMFKLAENFIEIIAEIYLYYSEYAIEFNYVYKNIEFKNMSDLDFLNVSNTLIEFRLIYNKEYNLIRQ